MSSLNRVLIMGTLGQRPTLKTTRNGKAYCRMSLATDSWGKDEKGESRTQWHSIHVFGRQAEIAAQYLEKGRQVLIEGMLDTTKTEENGVQKWNTFITANRVTFVNGRRNTDSLDSPVGESEDDDGAIVI